MKNHFYLFIFLISTIAHSQVDSSEFQKIEIDMRSFKPDTSEVPNDDLTKEIRELRKIRGAFNINNIIEYKIAEQRSKKEIPEEDINKLETFFKEGNGKKWIENAVIWIYRNQYTYEEVKQIEEFYKTSAGQKMASSAPIIIFESMKAAELITENLMKSKTNQ